MFKEMLREVVEGTDGGIAGLLMGSDGIAVEMWSREGEELDIQTVGMELSVILKDILRASVQLDAGVAHEVAIQAEKITTLVRMVNDEYFVAVALRPDGNYGKARFMLRLAAPRLLAALS